MDFSVGQLLLLPLAPNFVPEGTLQCNGQLVSISKWPKLYDLVNVEFGGDGHETFGVPDIPPMQPAGGAPIYWYIVADGASFGGGSEALIGEVRLFVSLPPFKGPWTRSEGQLLPIITNQALYSLLGTSFGGNGANNFRLPNVAPIKLANGVELHYYIALDGVFPSMSCNATTPVSSPNQSYDSLMSTIFMLPYPNPGGLCAFALCQGQTLPVASPWLPLFSLLGNRFGGTGVTNFLLPNLPPVDGVSFALLYNGFFPSRSS